MSDSLNPRYGTVNRDYAIRMATTPPDQDGPVWMVNLMKYRDVADYADGRLAGIFSRPDGRVAGITGRAADDLYAPIKILADIGAAPVLFGDVEQQLIGQPTWDRVAVVKYATRKSFIDMQARPDFQDAHQHKDAGMKQTIVMGCQPLPYPEAPAGLVQPDWDEVPHPSTAEDGPITVVHVMRFADPEAAQSIPDEMVAYASTIAQIAARQGARVAGWFAVEGTIVGDGRDWHQIRFNQFPSKRAFMALATDPDRLAAQQEHREKAIADTYTMIMRATIDQVAASIG